MSQSRRRSRGTRRRKLASGARTAESRTDALRARLAERLPDMLDAAIGAYHRIATPDGDDDAKRFAASQTGAKAALGHIEQLLALAEAVLTAAPSAGDDTERASTDAQRLIAAARVAMADDGADADTAEASDAPNDLDRR